MRLHSDTITHRDFIHAAHTARVAVVDLSTHGSRSRDHAFKFTLSGTGAQTSQWGSSDHRCATWDEWGIFLAHLFDVDPIAHTGKNSYLSGQHYHWVTGDRFRTLTPEYQHKRHRWESRRMFDPDFRDSGYHELWCACRAIQRCVKYGESFWSLLLENKPVAREYNGLVIA